MRGKGSRTISISAEESLQQQGRLHNQTEAGRKSLRERVVVEHRIARLVQLGIRKSRYFGRTKTCLHVVLAAMVANVSLVVGYCRHQAEQAEILSPEAATAGATVGILSEEVASATKNGLGAAFLAAWTRFFAISRPVWA